MTDEQLHDTKLKIINSARELFALKGFEGASVREIASSAGVNIAALNYHFSSKQNLFFHIMQLGYQDTSKAIEDYIANNPDKSVEEFAVWTFRYFLEKASMLRSFFKMMMSDMEMDEGQCPEEEFGPPGSRAFAQAIMKELNTKVSEADMFWAVKSIFSSTVHMALIYSNHFSKLEMSAHPYHTQEVLEKDIRRLVKVVLKDLRQ
jgi:AcrR family transcriptional regulator